MTAVTLGAGDEGIAAASASDGSGAVVRLALPSESGGHEGEGGESKELHDGRRYLGWIGMNGK